MGNLFDFLYLIFKIFASYALYTVLLVTDYSVDYAFVCSFIFYFGLILSKTEGTAIITMFICGIILSLMFASLISLFPQYSIYFWVFGDSKTYLF